MNRNKTIQPRRIVPWHVLLEGTCAALVCWVLGADVFDKHGWPKLGDFFELLTVVSFLATAARFILNYWHHPWSIWTIFIFSCLGLLLFQLENEISVPQPHVVIALATTHATNDILELTDPSLIIPVLVSVRFDRDKTPVLFVPVFQKEGLGMVFMVANRSLVEVEGLELLFRFPRKVTFKMGDGWIEAVTSRSLPKDLNFVEFRWKSPETLSPGDGRLSGDSVPSPEIFVLQHPYDPIFGQGIPIVMTVRAKRMTPFQIRFILMIGSEPSDWNALLLPQVISNPESNWVKSNGVVYLKLSYTNK